MLAQMDMFEAAPGLYCIPIPIPSPLAQVNCYLARGSHGWTVVDTGFHTPEAEGAWTRALRRLGITWKDIERIVVTHYHPDHFGAAGWLQQKTGAPVLMHAAEAATARWVWATGSEGSVGF
ncbi:MAG TPA: MBL fold metallo-hydrolase, partial [Bacillota bacterium]